MDLVDSDWSFGFVWSEKIELSVKLLSGLWDVAVRARSARTSGEIKIDLD